MLLLLLLEGELEAEASMEAVPLLLLLPAELGDREPTAELLLLAALLGATLLLRQLL